MQSCEISGLESGLSQVTGPFWDKEHHEKALRYLGEMNNHIRSGISLMFKTAPIRIQAYQITEVPMYRELYRAHPSARDRP
ncbi:MAG: hypothetical protein AAES65_03250 [Candidatus Thiodiazotropha sp. (ex. Lucinoma kazani)]